MQAQAIEKVRKTRKTREDITFTKKAEERG